MHLQCRRPQFHSWVGKICWRRERLLTWASLMAQLVKNPPAMRETWVQSLGWEDPLEMVKATHFSILAPGLYSPWGCKELDTTEQLSHSCIHAALSIYLTLCLFSPPLSVCLFSVSASPLLFCEQICQYHPSGFHYICINILLVFFFLTYFTLHQCLLQHYLQ